jgi:TolA-binding protein
MPAVSADTLYQNALRDFSTGKYDLARQEFGDYVKNFPTNDLASNAQFYLGEISYAQGDFQNAIAQYEIVTGNYPKSFKLAAAQLKKAFAEIELGMNPPGYATFAKFSADSPALTKRAARRPSSRNSALQPLHTHQRHANCKAIRLAASRAASCG